MLLSYALNPTHATQSLADVAARHGQTPPDFTARGRGSYSCARPALREEVDKRRHARLREIDLPLAPVLYRMEQAGVRIDTTALSGLSRRVWRGDWIASASASFELAGQRFNINSPKQLGEVLFTHLGSARPSSSRQGQEQSRPRRMCWKTCGEPRSAAAWCSSTAICRSSSRIMLTRCRCWPMPNRACTRHFRRRRQRRDGSRQSIRICRTFPIRTELGREIRAAFIAAPGTQLLSADYSQIELRLLAHFSGDPLLMRAYAEDIDIHTLTASEVFGVPADTMDKETRNRAKAVNFGIVYGISPFGLAAQLGIPQAEAQGLHRALFCALPGREGVHREDARGNAPRRQCAHDVRPRAADSRYREPQPQPARICRAHRRSTRRCRARQPT